jgi:crotonobetainyl-CoA:carnitine CoA-transferase CaiB-like acyl-CoA transferase
MAGALDGLRVLDLSWGIAGPLGVLLIAEMGADVVKVEPPGGDPFRAHPGSPVWHRSRRSIELDLDTDRGRRDLLGLVDSADVLVEAFSPGTMDGWGLGFEILAERNPALVVCSIPAYPPGHRAASRSGHDSLVQARSGQQSEQPGWRPGPVHLHFQAPSMGACFLAASGILAALVDRERTGRGQHVQTSLYQGVLAFTTQIWQELEHEPVGIRAMMQKSYPPGVHQATIFECAGGEWVHAATMSGGRPTRTLEEIIGLDPVDPAALYADPVARSAHQSAIRAVVLRWSRDELVRKLHDAGLGAEPIVPMDGFFDHPQTSDNHMAVEVDDPSLGITTQVGVPIVMSRTPGAVTGPRPEVGQHTAEVLAEVRPRVRRSATALPDPSGPLAGLTVLDLGQFLAGPFAAMLLGDFGAEVIKVEPIGGDPMRNVSLPFIGSQRGKAGIAVDLRSPEGVAVVLRLAEQVDVVHHNMTKGTADRLGIGYETLQARNPSLVHCNTYAYGPTGTMSDFGGLDPLYQAASGLEYEAGAVAEGNGPLYLRFGMTDTANAFLSLVGVLAALFHRARTGEGQDLWTSLFNGAAMLSSDVVRRADGEVLRRPGLDRGLHGTSPCDRLYATQDGWVQVAAMADEHWRGLCTVLGLTGLADDPGAAGYAGRVVRRREIEPILEAVFLTATAVIWVGLLDAAGVPAEVVVDTVDGELAMYDADNERLGLVTDVEHPRLGRIRQFGSLVHFSASPEPMFGPPPMRGEHTRSVLERHGFDAADIDDLLARGIIADASGDYPWQV